MENTPIDIKVSLARRIFYQIPEKILILNHLTGHDRMGKWTISRYCLFKGIVSQDLGMHKLILLRILTVQTPEYLN